MKAATGICGLAALLLVLPTGAHAQVFEVIKWCKGNWRAAVACIVVEKGVEKIVEKQIEDWLELWKQGQGRKEAPPPPAVVPAPGQQITRLQNRVWQDFSKGQDYRKLMLDLEKLQQATKPTTPGSPITSGRPVTSGSKAAEILKSTEGAKQLPPTPAPSADLLGCKLDPQRPLCKLAEPSPTVAICLGNKDEASCSRSLGCRWSGLFNSCMTAPRPGLSP